VELKTPSSLKNGGLVMNKIFIIAIFVMVFVGGVSAMSANYYYNPQCGHCQKIAPFMQEVQKKYIDVTWNFLDTSIGSYAISGTPTLVINTDDDREITLVGSYEIPRYLECEINQQSNLNCETLPANECKTGSWFVKE